MVQLERTPRSAGRTRLECRSIGAALLVHSQGELNPRVRAFAGGLAKDPEHTLVVVDLPEESPDETWESVAKVLKRRGRRSFRVVIGRPTPETAMTVGRLLADRLARTVLTSDGRMVAAAAGGLFVPEDCGTGWMVFRPRRPSWVLYSPASRPVPRVSRRFPVPKWDHAMPSGSFPTSAVGTAEPVPGGVWIRRTDQPQAEHDVHRRRLAVNLLCPPDQLAVVLGSPGASALSPADVEGFWNRVPLDIRPLVRFVPYGPVELPERSALGQVLADRLRDTVTVYAGVPTAGAPGTGTSGPQMRFLGEDGTPKATAFVRELVYRPGSTPGGASTPPVLRGHRPPVDGLPDISTGLYQYAPDAVLSVIQSGLWLGPPVRPADLAAVAGIPPDPSGIVIYFDASAPEAAGRMRLLAEEVRQKLDPALGDMCRILPAPTTPAAEQAPGPAPEAAPSAEPAAHGADPAPPGAAPAIQEAPPAMPGAASVASTARPGTPGATATATPGAAPATPEAATATPGAAPTAPAAAPAAPKTPPAVPGAGSESGSEPAPEAPPAAVSVAAETAFAEPAPPDAREQHAPPPAPAPIRPRALRLESAPPTESAPAEPAPAAAPRTGAVEPVAPQAPRPARPSASMPTAAAAPRPAARPKAAGAAVRVQPVPTPEVCAAPLSRGIEQERTWLRRTLQQQYDAAASFVARILSESPGLRGGSRTSADDVVTDLVAVRLYLSGGTERIDRAVRGATVGPHVPLARCVASGLRRLPSYRGATMMRTTLSDAEWAWYGERRLVTEWGFGSALTTAHRDVTGDVDVLIWSMTARRTVLLDPAVPDRVLYLPGTSFKVLGALSDERRVLLLRELTGPEIGADGSVDVRRLPLDDIAMSGLEQARTEWQDAQPAERLPATAISALRHPPGLILTGFDPRKGTRQPGTAPSREGTTP